MPPTPKLSINHTPLSQSTFSPFGTVIQNPSPRTSPLPPPPLAPSAPTPPLAATLANQNTALKYSDISPVTNTYAHEAPSRVPGKQVMNLFSCFPRELRRPSSPSAVGEEERGEMKGIRRAPVFPVRVLERHPFTTQSLIPLGLAASDASARYLVVVAPTRAVSGGGEEEEGRGPDLRGLRAFLGHGGQGVTYGVGTWHAPMVVVGSKRVDFVDVQARNGVLGEECEEVEIGDGVEVFVRLDGAG